jgi:hypothetical protein
VETPRNSVFSYLSPSNRVGGATAGKGMEWGRESICSVDCEVIMAESKNFYLVCYDIRNAKRWSKAYKLLQGYGERLQYSIFRCPLTMRNGERLRWQLAQILK